MTKRNICITAADGQTGHLIAELLLTDDHFKKHFDTVTCLALDPSKCKDLEKLGAHVVAHEPGRVSKMANVLKKMGVDAIMVIPPTHVDKFDITHELITATKKAGVPNVCFLSSAGCDLADPQKQPRLREFIDLEQLILAAKGDASTAAGHSPVVIRAGFYAENVLLYAKHMREEHTFPAPLGEDHKFAPIALGDVAQVAAHVLSGKGKHGFSDKHRGQLIVLTGPMLATGDELATAASQALGVEIKYENISEREAKRMLKSQSALDQSEMEYLLEYYALVREGKTNYISTLAFHDTTQMHPQEPVEFFKVYKGEFAGNGAVKHKQQGNGTGDEQRSKKRKTGK
ncbi:MAG: hypothetical protein FRX48_01196 [Lasallia pustulata]|uniref:NmrA-like domain-containing protein n=1 Tax=Lasallia pustulata TaxID=136370 RepID=A0A5M8PYC7_9LECA|nr:MAG: hypothetical protein FRX48_01196 [Lasallia pustulata]